MIKKYLKNIITSIIEEVIKENEEIRERYIDSLPLKDVPRIDYFKTIKKQGLLKISLSIYVFDEEGIKSQLIPSFNNFEDFIKHNFEKDLEPFECVESIFVHTMTKKENRIDFPLRPLMSDSRKCYNKKVVLSYIEKVKEKILENPELLI